MVIQSLRLMVLMKLKIIQLKEALMEDQFRVMLKAVT